MATKTEMIEFIVDNSDPNEYSKEDLELLSYNAVKKIFNTVETIEVEDDDVESNEVIEEKVVEPKKETKIFTVEIPEMSEEEAKEYIKSLQEKFKQEVKIEEIKEIDPMSLSPVQRRAFERRGSIPKK